MSEIGVITVLYGSEGWKPMAVGDGILNIVVDNTPGRDLNSEYSGSKTVVYIPLGDNCGIAYAQNIGISEAFNAGCRYIVFFDQDSEPNEQLVRILRDRFEWRLKSGERIGAIGPALYEQGSGRRYKSHVSAEIEEGETPMLISSGMFTSLDVLEDVGKMEEGLFIDFVDSEWCMRCKLCGYRIYMTNLCSLRHKVGEKSARFMGFPLISSATVRYYYKYRNTMLLLRRGYVPVIWKLKTILRSVVTFMLVPFIELFKGRRMEIMGNMTKGIRDSFRYKYKGLKNEERR